LTVPLSIAAGVPAEASKILRQERELIEFCRAPNFSLQELAKRIQSVSAYCDLPRLS
jgi:hypothetical protein